MVTTGSIRFLGRFDLSYLFHHWPCVEARSSHFSIWATRMPDYMQGLTDLDTTVETVSVVVPA